jgi:hypothetical protein
MKKKTAARIKLNEGTTLALGAAVAACTKLLVDLATHDMAVWLLSIPLGVAASPAIGAGVARNAARAEGTNQAANGEQTT